MERKSPLGRAFLPWIGVVRPVVGKKSQDFFGLCERKMGLSSAWMAFLIRLPPKNLRLEVKIIPLINRCLSPIAEKTLIFLCVTACQSEPSCYLCIRIWKTGATFSTSWEKIIRALRLIGTKNLVGLQPDSRRGSARKTKVETAEKKSRKVFAGSRKALNFAIPNRKSGRRKRRCGLKRMVL